MEFSRDKDDTITAIFISSKKMVADFKLRRPPCEVVDTTFNTNFEGYRLVAFVYKNIETGKTSTLAFGVVHFGSSS